MSALHLRPWTVKRAHALKFVADVHRKLPKVQGAMWCVSVRRGAEIVGVALVGMPSQEQTTDELDMLRVLRVAVKSGIDGVNGHANNACSMLYGACWRAARAMGVTSMDTHTHLDEGGGKPPRRWVDRRRTDGRRRARPQGTAAQEGGGPAPQAALVGAWLAAREGGVAVTLTSAQALALVGDAVAVLFLLALLVLAALALSSVERGG